MRELKHGDVYTFYSERNSIYGAFQILEKVPNWSRNSEFMCVMLNYCSIKRPNLSDLENISVMFDNRPRFISHKNLGKVFYIVEKDRIDSDYCYLGKVPVFFTENSNSVSSISSLKLHLDGIYEYSLLEESVRSRIKECICNPKEIEINGNIYRTSDGILNEDMLDLKYIDNFCAGNTIVLKNAFNNITEYTSRLPIVRNLNIQNNELDVLDLRNTNLSDIKIDASNLHKLYIDNNIRQLELTNEINPNLQIIQETNGKYLNLLLSNRFTTNFGLENLSSLTVFDLKEFDFSVIEENFKNLQELNIRDVDRLSNFDINDMVRLRKIIIRNVYYLDNSIIFKKKSLSGLEMIYLYSIPRDFGDLIKKEFKGTELDCNIELLRSDEWIKNNLGNPFAKWLDSEYIPVKVSKKAISVYKKFRKELLKEFKEQDNLSEKIEKITIEYINIFNDFESEKFAIETLEREEICEALFGILKDASEIYNCDFDLESIMKIVDQNRNW